MTVKPPPAGQAESEVLPCAGGSDGGRDVELSAPRPSLVETLPTIDRNLLAAFAEAAAPNSLRALTSDFVAFEAWCRGRGAPALAALAPTVADYLRARDAAGAAPASLARYKASISRVHVLARLVDPTRDPLVALTLRALRRAQGTVQKQARPLRFKGAVKDVRFDTPRGVSLGAILYRCGTSVISLRDAALLSVAYDTGLRAAELVALTIEDLVPAIDADAGLIMVRRTKSDQEGEGATAYLSPRSMRALRLWFDAARIEAGTAVPAGVRPAHAGAASRPRRALGAGREWRAADGPAPGHARGLGTYPLHCRGRGADAGCSDWRLPAGDDAGV